MNALSVFDERRWGVMTVSEMVCHLREAFAEVGRNQEPMLHLPGGVRPPWLLKILALRVPRRWPMLVQTVPRLDRAEMPAPAEFAHERERLHEAFERFLDELSTRHNHPYFGRMTAWDWQRWGYLHADHHLRQFGR